jgi:NAD(P)-dependent dehydrogenase (short-subunit alcohol dehydrogenase family)
VKNFDLTGKHAVVIGGSGALGTALCQGLAEAGAAVVVAGRSADAASAAVSALPHPQRHFACSVDTMNKASLAALCEQAVERWGRVDILVNAAGGNQPAATASPGSTAFYDLPAEALQEVMHVNWLGTVLACQVFGQQMARQGSGCMLNISSMAADRPLTRVVGYASAKAAVENFTRWLAVHMAHTAGPDIRVNAIAPGFFLSNQNRYLLLDAETGALTPRGEQILAHTPMGRFGSPDDLAGAAVWLCSDAARFVTGIVVPVDGGFSAYSGV